MAHLPLREAVRVWAYVGLNSFGGPAGQIAVMHREVVDRRKWISERRFLHALNYCMVLPGPEAQQLATYIGWLTNGVRGGLAAGSLFILPGFVVMMALSMLYAAYGDVRWVSGLLFGLQAAVVVVVIQALTRVASRTLKTSLLVAIAVAAFLALFVFAVPFPLVIVAAGLVGWAAGRSGSGQLPAFTADTDEDEPELPAQKRRSALITAAACLVLWLVPVFALLAVLGPSSVFTQEAVLFSKVAVVTFGGAYAVLAYVSQVVVQDYGWLSASDMTTGLGLAETTPGPLIMVVQFVGFLAAYRNPGTLSPMLAGVLGAVITVWVTFVPCFMFIFAGAPFMEQLRHSRGLHNALTAVGAAVTGVIANLALWFAMSTFFTVRTVQYGPIRTTLPELGSLDLVAVAIAVVAAILVFRFRMSTLGVLGICTLLGIVAALVGVT